MFDIRDDQRMHLVGGSLKTAELPAYVTDASLHELGVDADIPDRGFACTLRGKPILPCHTKAACFVSRVYFESQRPGLDSTQALEIDANLSRMERLHHIQEHHYGDVLESIKRSHAPVQTPVQMANAMAILSSRDPDAHRASEMIQSARELKQAGASGRFIEQWLFDRPLAGGVRQLRAIASTVGSEKLAGLVAELEQVTSRERVARLPEFADALQDALGGSTAKTHRKLAGLQTQPTHDVRLLGRDIPRAKLEPHLTKIAMLTESPLYHQGLRVIQHGWSEVLESLDEVRQRRIVDLVNA